MATHSSVLAWRIPGTAEPGGLPSMGSHRVIALAGGLFTPSANWEALYLAYPPGKSLILDESNVHLLPLAPEKWSTWDNPHCGGGWAADLRSLVSSGTLGSL